MAGYRKENNMEMRTITVKRADLLETLKTNLELHKKEYGEAVDEYKKAAVIALDKKKAEILAAMKILRAKLEENPVSPNLGVNLGLDVVPPTSHESDYTKVIKMTEWDTREEVPLDSHEFEMYVLNQWDWKVSFESTKFSNSRYLS